MNAIFGYIKGDKVIWVVAIILSVFSVLAVYSATSSLVFKQKDWNTEYYLIKHVGLILLGFFLMYLIHLMRIQTFARLAQLLYFISVPLLLYTLIAGVEINEARRWLSIPGLGLTFQTSDIAKIALVLYVARILGNKELKKDDLKSVIYALFLPVFIIVGLIAPANNSTAGLMLFICLLLFYYGGVKTNIITRVGGYTILGMVLLFGFMYIVKPDSTRLTTLTSRVNSFIFEDIEPGSHEEQAMIAIANGRLFGKLPGQSTQKYKMPHPYSDSLYPFFIEEYGFIGGLLLLLMFLIILYRGIKISIRAPGTFSGLAALGITLMIVFQAMIHILVAVRLFPTTGQPLPFVSMGGTSILFAFFSLGILLSISKEVYNNDEEHTNVKKAI
jgi:cell division protein FtsW